MRTALLTAMIGIAGALVPDAGWAISGGHPATGKEFGFVRFLQIHWPGSQMGSCTGSVISERIVLTAAHCVVNAEGKSAVGIDVLRKPSDTRGIVATAYRVHSGYVQDHSGDQPILMKNDVAVLILRDPAPRPYARTPVDIIVANSAQNTLSQQAQLRLDLQPSDARRKLDELLSRDESGRPYVTQVGFGRFGCKRETRTCSEGASTKAKYIQQLAFNFKTDRAILTDWCDESSFSFAATGANLCTKATAETTRSRTEHGPDGIYGPQPGDSGGPAVVFDKENRAFIVGTLSYGGFGTYDINMNLVEHLAFLREAQAGFGSTFREVPLQLPALRLPKTASE